MPHAKNRRTIQLATLCSVVAFAMIGLTTTVAIAGLVIGLAPAGVDIDANGVLKTRSRVDDDYGRLTKQRKLAAKRTGDADVMRTSKLRKISLNRLEAAVKARVDEGELPTTEMNYLVGLTEITHVFFYPESNDIVIAGPAEGFYEDVAGRVVGIVSDKPALRLEDLVVALRAYSPMGDRASVIACSIDPTREGLEKMQAYLAGVGGKIRHGDERAIVRNLKENLGLQTVQIKGISPKTHFAHVMLEADYRMKLIGIGLLNPHSNITTYVDRAKPSAVSRNALQRWYFQPNYDVIRVSDDDLAMEMVDSSVKLVGENERVGKDGVRAKAGGVDRASQVFCNTFTKSYNDLSESQPVYSELKSLCDLSIVAAYVQHQDYYSKAGWDMDFFGDEQNFPVETYAEPKQVETAVNAVWKGSRLMTPIGGGVNIQAREALRGENLKYDEKGKVAETREAASIKDIPADQWWWD